MENKKEVLELVRTYRISKKEFEELNIFCQVNNLSKSEVIRQGIKMFMKINELSK